MLFNGEYGVVVKKAVIGSKTSGCVFVPDLLQSFSMNLQTLASISH